MNEIEKMQLIHDTLQLFIEAKAAWEEKFAEIYAKLNQLSDEEKNKTAWLAQSYMNDAMWRPADGHNDYLVRDLMQQMEQRIAHEKIVHHTNLFYRGQDDREWLVEPSNSGKFYVHINGLYPCLDDEGNILYFDTIDTAVTWIIAHLLEADKLHLEA